METDPDRYVDGADLYQFVDSGPASRLDPKGMETFISVSSPSTDSGSHLAIDLWYLPCANYTVGKRVKRAVLLNQGAYYLDGIELNPVDAKATQIIGGIASTIRAPVQVSVIFPRGNMPVANVVQTFNSGNSLLDQMMADAIWGIVEATAKTYRWAEHGGLRNGIFPGPVTDWPNSFYQREGNNSNTFVRYVAKQMGWPLPADLPTLGNLLPVDPQAQVENQEFLTTIKTAPVITK